MQSKLLAAAASLALVSGAATAQETLEMTSAFGQNLPILGTGAVDFVTKINSISSDVEFEHYDPGKLVPTLEALDAVSNGSVDAAFATSGYWQGKIGAASLFAAVPFGPEAGEFMGWILYDDGADLWQEMYDSNGYNVVATPCGVIAPETSGWFKKEINTVEDLQGLNMRFFGLGAKVMQKLGVSTSLLGASDIFPALERGAIDATEFSMPKIDARLGFHKIAKYNYFPGWHQQVSVSELLMNKDSWNKLTDQQKRIIQVGLGDSVMHTYAETEAKNFDAMALMQSKHGVTVKRWPDSTLAKFEAAWNEVVKEESAKDPLFKKVADHFYGFRAKYKVWGDAQSLNNTYLK